MANPKLAHPANAPGDLFVDTTCIDCPICRQAAPATFGDADGQAVVARQPVSDEERRRALIALVSCPAGSIGTRTPADLRPAISALPEKIEEPVYWCGFASSDAFGAQSYLILRPEGNVLIDSPRFAEALVKRIEKLGGLRWMVLTHRDDVADHEKFRRRFGCERVIHAADAVGELGAAERKLEGAGPWLLAPDLKIIGVPGHTAGHIAILHRDKFLFTGDHLFWSRTAKRLHASRSFNWYSWDKQLDSLEKLLPERFSWILPGHGERHRAEPEALRAELAATIELLRGLNSPGN